MDFACRECFYYIFTFISNDQSIQMICFISIQFWWAVMFLESCPFLLGCPICWHITLHSILSLSLFFFFFFFHYPLWFLLFLFLFHLFGFSLSSSWWVWPEVCQFRLPFQRTSSWFFWFFPIVFWISILLISSLIFMISFSCWLSVSFFFF